MYRFNLLFVIAICLVFGSLELFSQPNPQRAKERIDVAKKMRLLEILELNEAEADKFLAKYSIIEKNIKEKNDNFQNANEALIEYIEKNPSGKELSDKTNAVITAQEELHRAMESKLSGMKQVLSEQNFSKFVAFEIQFNRKMRKMLMFRGNPDGFPPDDGDVIKRGRRKGVR